MKLLELHKSRKEFHHNYKLDTISIEEIQKSIEEHGIKNKICFSSATIWNYNDIKLDEEMRDLTSREKAYMKVITEMSMIMEGIIPTSEEDENRRER